MEVPKRENDLMKKEHQRTASPNVGPAPMEFTITVGAAREMTARAVASKARLLAIQEDIRKRGEAGFNDMRIEVRLNVPEQDFLKGKGFAVYEELRANSSIWVTHIKW